jgi:hypothetical protein
VQHEATKRTKTHEGEWWETSRYREPAAKARAKVVSREIIAAAIEVHRQLGPGLLVEDLVIVELKSVERLEPVHELQLLTYLRLSRRWLGLLVNFNSVLVKHGLRRMLNG